MKLSSQFKMSSKLRVLEIHLIDQISHRKEHARREFRAIAREPESAFDGFRNSNLTRRT